MALTEPQRLDVRLYMGWSERFHQTDSALEQAMNALDTKPEAEALVLTLIEECKRIDESIVTAEKRYKAMSVGPIDLNPMETQRLADRGRMYVGRIASILGVEVRNDVFSSTLPSGRASALGMTGGGNRQLIG